MFLFFRFFKLAFLKITFLVSIFISKIKVLNHLICVEFEMSSLKLAYSDRSNEQTKFYNELFEKQELTDVTIACDDGFQIKAHRTIISASSLFFREVIMNSNNTSPFFYLKGVNQENLQSLLEFIYEGETVVKTEKVDDLVAIGNDLKILGIMEMEVKDGKSSMEDIEKPDTFEAPLNLTKSVKCEQKFIDTDINSTNHEIDKKVFSKEGAKARKSKKVKKVKEGKKNHFDEQRGQNFFPLLPVDPNSKEFTSTISRSYLTTCLNILGFSQGSFKKYGVVRHKPIGWPDEEVSWENFKPNYSKSSDNKIIFRALFNVHMKGISFDTYYQGRGGWKWTTEEKVEETISTSSLVH